MNALLNLDFYLWKYLIPRVNPFIFKYRVASVLAVSYISLFKLPRKYIKHYFFGKGQNMNIDTKEVITSNPDAFDLIVSSISTSRVNGIRTNNLIINQSFVNNPNYKYSIGSFIVSYTIIEDLINIKLNSRYKFCKDNDRKTKFLHNWLFSLQEKGYAKEFNIIGNTWLLNYSDISSIKDKIDKPIRKFAFEVAKI